jgi:hypothetical protein
LILGGNSAIADVHEIFLAKCIKNVNTKMF